MNIIWILWLLFRITEALSTWDLMWKPKHNVCDPKVVYKKVHPHICESSFFWKQMHQYAPNITTFLDIGSNLGYKSALIFNLWSPGSRITPNALKTELIEHGVKYVTNYCKEKDIVTSDRTIRPIRVYSIDGNSKLIHRGQDIVQNKWPEVQWDWLNYAISNSNGTAHFRQKRGDDDRWEGNKMYVKSYKNETAVIKMRTIDDLKIQADFLKIDTEGHDIQVLKGAKTTLKEVKILIWEMQGYKETIEAYKMTKYLKNTYKFKCYLMGTNHFLLKAECMDKLYDQMKLNSNVICVTPENIQKQFDTLSII